MIRPLDPLLRFGPVTCTWMPHPRGTPAEPLAATWLAERLLSDGSALGIWRDRHGRPRLGEAYPDHDINWSHSGGHLLVALGEGVQLGADLEFLRPRTQALTLAKRFFTAAESATLSRLPFALAETAFVRLWCAKEAVLKAHGRGIAFGLEKLEFSLRGDNWALTACDPALGRPQDWHLQAFAPMRGYLATLAWRELPTATDKPPTITP